MAGHGHVTPNPDGSKARCGGPPLCSLCNREAATLTQENLAPAHAPKGYRRKLLRISNNFLPAMFGRGVRQFYEVCGGGLPPDTRVVNCRMDDDFRTLIVCLESDEFDEVSDSGHIPEIEPQLRMLDLRPLSFTEAN